MPKLAELDHGIMMGMLEAGVVVTAFARQFGVTRKVARTWRDRYNQTGSVKDLPRSGRPRVTSALQDASIVNKAVGNRLFSGM